MKSYQKIENNIYYTERQKALKEICTELNLEIFFPDYHGKKGDAGTVFIDSKTSINGMKDICTFESTDINGNIDFGFLNRGSIDLRRFKDIKPKLKKYILDRITEEDARIYNIDIKTK